MVDSNKIKKLLGMSTSMPLGAGANKPSFMTGSSLNSHAHGAGCGCHHHEEEDEE
jgi:hypothetical protein